MKDPGSENLMDLSKKVPLPGLASVLNAFDLGTSRRVVKSISPKELLKLEARAAQTDLPPLHSLTSYWRIDVREQPERVQAILERLNALREVDLAYRELATSDPSPVNDGDDIYAAGQTYLDAAPTGIDARWAWTQANSEGAGVAVVDLEQGWFPNHEDLVAKTPTLIYGDNRDGVSGYKGDHGTAVLGEMIAEDNTRGVVGIAPAVTSVRMVSHYELASDTALHVADAIVAAAPVMAAGDLLLLEVQRNFQPTETDDADFDAIRLAVALGIIVVEAAGNGGMDLDTLTDSAGDLFLNRGNADFRDSGAIMVGAAQSPVPHNRWAFSNFGSRIDCYGWGENVTSCGYGDLDGGAGDDSTYTDTFQGTSSASPIVTGAALVLQGRYAATTGTRLSPAQMRSLLSDPVTGTPQGPGVAGNIGVMPDLRAIMDNTLGLVPDVYLRDDVGDTGVVPSAGAISASPDLILRPTAVADPAASFGEGSGTENSNTLGYEAEAGQDNFIYVRMKNRGMDAATAASVSVYWSEVSTLVTPDMWSLIGTTAPVDVPQGDTLVVAGPVVWPKAQIPATGHYCFVGIADQAVDAAPPLPSALDWNGFTSLIRNHNNVTWRNFNVVDNEPDPSGDPTELPFIIAGAPDRARVFDLEILQGLPKGARVSLEVPLGLFAELKAGHLWKAEIDRKRQIALLYLPTQPRIAFCGARLAAGARHRARFLVRGGRGVRWGGNLLAIRQVYQDLEVGRVSWNFQQRRDKKG